MRSKKLLLLGLLLAMAVMPSWGQRPTLFNVRRPAGPVARLLPAKPAQVHVLPAGAKTPRKAAPTITSKARGIVIQGDSWNDLGEWQKPRFVCSFTPSESLSLDTLYKNNRLNANGGGAFTDDMLYFVNYGSSYGWYGYYYSYRLSDWERTSPGWSMMDDDQVVMTATDAAYCKADGKVYGCYYNSSFDGFDFGVADYTTWTRTTISKLDKQLVGVGINAQGEVYAIDIDGNLIKIDKSTGAQTTIGNTGVIPSTDPQSAAIDPVSGKMLWAGHPEGGNPALYEVDLANAQTTKISDMPDNAVITCLDIPTVVADGVPSAVSDLSTEFYHGSLTGHVTFTLPTKDSNGKDLTNDVTYYIIANGDTVRTGSGAPGAAVDEEVTLKGGQVRLIVATANNSGNGDTQARDFWVGPDVPGKVSEVVLFHDPTDNNMILTWKAPTTTEHDAYLSDSLTYRITRYPDSVVVAEHQTGTRFSEVLNTKELAYYYYTVQADNEGQIGEPVESPRQLLGEYITPDYKEQFKDEYSSKLYTVIDNNKDGATFTYHSGSMQYDSGNGADDWLLTPPIYLKADREYTFSADADLFGNETQVGVYMGHGDDPSNFNEIIPMTVTYSSGVRKLGRTVTVDANGIYRFAIHAKCEQYSLNMFHISNINVLNSSLYTAPDAPSHIKAVAGSEGDLSASVTVTAPTKDLKGDALSALEKVELYRDGKTLVHTFASPAPGAELTYEDADEAITNGNHTYSAVGYNESGRGHEASTPVFIGYDTPLAPTDVKLSDNLDGTAKLTWTAPGTVGVNNGYVDPAELSYNIYTIDYASGQAALKLLTSVDENSYTAILPGEDADPAVLYYVVRAVENGLESDYGLSNELFTGRTATLPFADSFSNGSYEQYWAVSRTGRGYFAPAQSLIAEDEDNGLLYFEGSNDGEESTLSSSKISLAGANKPYLIFKYYAFPGYKASIRVEVQRANGDPETLKTINYADEAGEQGWHTCAVDLSGYKDAPYILLKLTGIATNHYVPIAIDNVQLRDVVASDLAIKMEQPQDVTAGEKAAIAVEISNLGSEAADSYTVNLYAGDKVVATEQGSNLAPFEKTTVNLSYPTSVTDAEKIALHATVDFASDVNLANNTTDTLQLTLRQPDLPAVDDLAGTEDSGKASLSWSEPTQAEAGDVVEDFESYKAFANKNIGDWKLVDGDGGYTMSLANFEFENQSAKEAYIVFNPTKAGIDTATVSAIKPHSGDQFLGSFASVAPANDDWLISPVLPKGGQVISFWAKSVSGDTPESMELRVSAAGRDTADLKTTVLDIPEVPSEWTRYEVQIPEDANYFAIHCTSQDKFLLMIDDISYERGEHTVLGYNIYRDGELVGQTDGDTRTYVDNDATLGNHTYQVTVRYEEGESPLSNAVIVETTTGIDAVISNADSTPHDVFTVDGKLVKRQATSMKNLPSGLYIINGRKAVKK